MNSFLAAKHTKICLNQKPIQLKGVNLGGWLMMEAYIMHAPNFPVKKLKREFVKTLGQRTWEEFEEAFRSHFIRKEDFQRISSLGFNCLRVPFHYAAVESKPYEFKAKGLRYLDQVIRWAREYKLWIILDLHAAPGSQNHDWHSDSFGKAEFWTAKNYQHRAIALWEFLADRYKDEECVAGYDLLNEAVLEDAVLLNRFYKELIGRIRGVDKNHILFVEGNRWAQNLECLNSIDDHNYALSVHTYEPIEFTGNFIPHLIYPFKDSYPKKWGKETSRSLLSAYAQMAEKSDVPIYVGEFGVNYRNGLFGEDQWLEDMLSLYQEFGFHWTYWTYKAIKNNIFPDGIFSFYDNPPWVNRPGPRMGWETYAGHWPARKQEMIESWHTKHFRENSLVLSVFKKYL